MAKSNAILATRDLVTLRLIAKRQGTAVRSAAYLLRFAETLPMSKLRGGPVAGPPVNRFPQFQQDHRGPVAGPPDFPESQQNDLFPHSASDVLSIDQSSLSVVEKASETVFDRLSEPAEHTPEQRAECSALMRGFLIHRLRHQGPHPPDKQMLAMMLGVCEWEHLKNWLLWMTTGHGGNIKGRHPEPPDNLGNPYAWLLKVAINHMHAIPANEQKPTLELLRGGKQLYTRWHTEGAK